jgi:hypothetical protein
MPTLCPQINLMHWYERGIQDPMWCICIPIFYCLLCNLAFGCPFKRFCLLHQFCNQCHDEGKVLNETLTWISHGVFASGMLIIVVIFVGFGSYFFFETI